MLSLFNEQLWVGSRRQGDVYIWDIKTGSHLGSIDIDVGQEGTHPSRGVSCIAEVDGKVSPLLVVVSLRVNYLPTIALWAIQI